MTDTPAIMHLKIRHLEVLVALIEAGSISRAAEQLGLSQPAVSIALSNLEEEFGFRLFHRSKGFFAPTSEAQILYAQAEQGLLAISRVKRSAKAMRAGASGNVVLASNGAAAINVLPPLIAAFQREYPRINIDLKIRSSRKVAAWVAGGEADIGLFDAPVPVSGMKAEFLNFPCVCIMRADDPLAALETVTPADLDGRALIAVTGDHPIDREVDRIMAVQGFRLERRLSSTYFAVARSMVAAGAGLALIDPMNGNAALQDGVICRPFEPRINFVYVMAVHDSQGLGKAAATIYGRLREALLPFSVPEEG